jgi:hypothetical protein
MIPRFLRTFLVISILIILSTLYIIYPIHPLQRYLNPQDGTVQEENILTREDHWDKGGVEPDFDGQRYVKWSTMDDDRDVDEVVSHHSTATTATTSKHRYHPQPTSDHHQNDRISHNTTHGGVIMSRLGNATAK